MWSPMTPRARAAQRLPRSGAAAVANHREVVAQAVKAVQRPMLSDMSAAPRPVVTAYVALGANLGDAAQTLRVAMQALDTAPGIRVLRASSLYRTAPIESSGPDYINAVAEVGTTLNAPDLLYAMQAIENAAGRERPYRNAPRTLDLDLLLYGNAHVASPTLTVPHPRMNERAFVLVPLAEVAPHLVDERALTRVRDQAIERMA